MNNKPETGGFILKKYEAVFILDIRKVDDDGKAYSKELVEFIESIGGKVNEVIAMGRKQFSYEIKKRKGGIYLNLFFELDPLKVIEIKDKYMLDERVLRNMIIVDERPAEIRSLKVVEEQ